MREYRKRSAHAKYMREYSKRPGKQAKKSEVDRRYREANKEKISAHKKRDYEANKETIKARVKRYALANPEKIRRYESKRFTKFKLSLSLRIECLRHTSPAFRDARVQEILNWAGTSHSYWVDSEIQNVLDNNNNSNNNN